MINGCDGYLVDFYSAPRPALGAQMPDLPRHVGAGADTKNRSRRLQLLLLPGAGEKESAGRAARAGVALQWEFPWGTRVNVPKRSSSLFNYPCSTSFALAEGGREGTGQEDF